MNLFSIKYIIEEIILDLFVILENNDIQICCLLSERKMLNTGALYKKDWWQKEAFKRFIPLILKHTKRDNIKNILDLGCGNGIVTEYISELFPEARILGIDASREMIKSAKDNCSKKNATFRIMNINAIEELCSQAVKYDLINANYVLHWLSIEQKKILFENLKKIMSPHCVVTIGSCQRFLNFLQVLDEEIRCHLNIQQDSLPIFHYFSVIEWRSFLRQYDCIVKDTYECLDTHPVLLSCDLSQSNNFLRTWLWGASAGKAAYNYTAEEFSPDFVHYLVNKLIKIFGTEKYYRNDNLEQENMLKAAFLEETLFLLAEFEKK